MHTTGIRVAILMALFAAGRVGAQGPRSEDVGSIHISREHVRWPAPSDLVGDLRSPDKQVRLKAFHLAGLSADDTEDTVWSRDTPSKAIGHAVVMPSQRQLRFAALGDDSSEQAIIAFEILQKSMLYVAVAVHTAQGWERIAASSCWCKYDVDASRDALVNFAQLQAAPEPSSANPQHYELVLRASGGGTGIYQQDEARFRVYHGELRTVLSFVSEHRENSSAGPTPSLLLERRWFRAGPLSDGTWGGILVEAQGRYPAEKFPEIERQIKPLQDRHLDQISCQNYRWNVPQFLYHPVNASLPSCTVAGQQP